MKLMEYEIGKFINIDLVTQIEIKEDTETNEKEKDVNGRFVVFDLANGSIVRTQFFEEDHFQVFWERLMEVLLNKSEILEVY